MARLKTLEEAFGYREAEDGIHIMETLKYGAYPPSSGRRTWRGRTSRASPMKT